MFRHIVFYSVKGIPHATETSVSTFLASVPVGSTDHTYVLWRGGGDEAGSACVAYWECGRLAQGCRDIYEGHIKE